jgi:hypothetical protein
MTLFIPTYFSPISQYSALKNSDEIIFEAEDNYEKQTYRNRCYIFGANGKQALNIPVKFNETVGKKKTKDALVDNNSNWQAHHLKSLQAAYRNSPFYEFYIDSLLPIFNKNYKFLLDVNLETFQLVSEALELDKCYSESTEYKVEVSSDFRILSSIKQQPKVNLENYIQMFDDKHGFLENLSILDLLFMEGPNAINLLEKLSYPS